MKRILLSLSLILVASGSAITAGTTGAWFSDTESSTGNIFTAGSIDLKIDHSLSTYNGNQVGGDLIVVSDPLTTFMGDDGSGNAVNLTFVHPAWAHNLEPTAHWIWATDPVVGPTTIGRQNTFTRTFVWNGPITSASLDLASDNTYDITLNGIPVGSNAGEFNYSPTVNFDVTGKIAQGVNTLVITAGNLGVANTDPASNPAGIIFKLIVHGQQLFSDPIDLPGTPFWNFPDVKPKDQGRDVFSLHVGTNDAWACLIVNNVHNNENDLTNPETDAGDVTPGPVGGGELGNFLNLFLWRDINGDGMFNPPTETVLSSGFFNGGLNLAIHDSTTGNGALIASSTEKVGAAWCMGTQTVDTNTGVITCADGPATENQSQTDSLTADLTFYATQNRNQPNFKCSEVNLNPAP